MWSCKDCHHIYHFSCAEMWAERRRDTSSNATWRWPCPTCKGLQIGGSTMNPTCWCGRWRHHSVKVIGNSCAQRCPGYKTCESPGAKCERFCQKLCHPGPCEPVECKDSCLLKRYTNIKQVPPTVRHAYRSPRTLPSAITRVGDEHSSGATTGTTTASNQNINGTNITQPASYPNFVRRLIQRCLHKRSARLDHPDQSTPEPNCLRRFKQRWNGLNHDNFKIVFGLIIVLACINTALGIWIAFHVGRWKHPLKYRDFTEKRRGLESLFGLLIGSIFLGMVKVVLTMIACVLLEEIVMDLFNLRRHYFLKTFLRFCMLLFVLGSLLDFTVL
jgi:hypothetical protein